MSLVTAKIYYSAFKAEIRFKHREPLLVESDVGTAAQLLDEILRPMAGRVGGLMLDSGKSDYPELGSVTSIAQFQACLDSTQVLGGGKLLEFRQKP